VSHRRTGGGDSGFWNQQVALFCGESRQRGGAVRPLRYWIETPFRVHA